MIDAKTFHPLRGHVEAGQKIKFSTGEILELGVDGFKWAIRDFEGKILYATNGAYDLTSWIVAREESGIR